MGWGWERALFPITTKNKARTICTCFKTSQTMHHTHAVAWAAAQQLESRQPYYFLSPLRFSGAIVFHMVPQSHPCFTATSFRGYRYVHARMFYGRRQSLRKRPTTYTRILAAVNLSQSGPTIFSHTFLASLYPNPHL